MQQVEDTVVLFVLLGRTTKNNSENNSKQQQHQQSNWQAKQANTLPHHLHTTTDIASHIQHSTFNPNQSK
jgi:hypothetical protein